MALLNLFIVSHLCRPAVYLNTEPNNVNTMTIGSPIIHRKDSELKKWNGAQRCAAK